MAGGTYDHPEIDAVLTEIDSVLDEAGTESGRSMHQLAGTADEKWPVDGDDSRQGSSDIPAGVRGVVRADTRGPRSASPLRERGVHLPAASGGDDAVRSPDSRKRAAKKNGMSEGTSARRRQPDRLQDDVGQEEGAITVGKGVSDMPPRCHPTVAEYHRPLNEFLARADEVLEECPKPETSEGSTSTSSGTPAKLPGAKKRGRTKSKPPTGEVPASRSA